MNNSIGSYSTGFLHLPGEYWYRFETRRHSSFDLDGDYVGDYSVHVYERMLPLIKRTPKGAWIEDSYQGKRLVLNDSRKKYAHPVKADALRSYIARQKRRITILNAQLMDSQIGLRKAEAMLEKELADLPLPEVEG